MKFCLSQATTLTTPFAADIAGYADGGCFGVEVWLTKLEQYLTVSTGADALALVADRRVTLAAAAVQGGLLLSEGDQRQAHFDHFRRRLDLCQQLQISTLVVVADQGQRADPATLQRAVVSLAQAGQWAAGYGVRLALEYTAGAAFCTCLDTALTLVEACGEPNVGVCLDVFHYYKGPSKPEDLARLTNQNLVHVQLCDVPGLPRELMTDADRVLPGEGDFHLTPIIDRLRQINYDGWVSVELMNPVLYTAKPSQVAELAMAALKRFA